MSVTRNQLQNNQQRSGCLREPSHPEGLTFCSLDFIYSVLEAAEVDHQNI